MPPELIDFLKTIFSALVGAGLTVAIIAKFGQSWFFKKLDSKYAFNLEKKKNELSKELQIEVSNYKSQLEVLGGQQSKFLEQKVNSILELNQKHYKAIKNIKDFTDISYIWIEEAMLYFHYQIKDGKSGSLSSYETYREMKEERWPKYKNNAKVAFDMYSESLALYMPILPEELVKVEMEVISKLKATIEEVELAFARAMNITTYIVAPIESDSTEKEEMDCLKKETSNSLKCKKTLDDFSEQLFKKSLMSGNLINNLLSHKTKG